MAFTFTDSNFAEMAMAPNTVAVVDFWAEWCGPCRLVGPVIETLATEYQGKVNIGKMDVDSNSVVPSQFGVRSIPTILFIKNGQVVDKHVGATTKSVLQSKIEALLN